MRLSDLERKNVRKNEAQFNKEQGTREIDINKDDVVKALSRDNDLAKRKLDELPEKIRKELATFFSEKFWVNKEVSNG